MSIKITYFVHGTTTDNEQHISSGWKDVELSALGVQQSKDLKEQAKDKTFDVVFCSDLKRAQDSAKLSWEGMYEIIPDARLRECNYGTLNGASSDIVVPMQEECINKPFPEGESYEDVKTRIADFLKFLKQSYDGKHIAIVAHKAPQLSLDVLLKNKTWKQALAEDWREAKAWKPGWGYEVKIDMDHLQKIIVKRWKHIQLDKPIELQPGVNLLLGKNGSGKTSLIGMVEAAAVSQTQQFNPTLDKEITEGERVATIEIKSGEADILVENTRRGNDGQWTGNDLRDRIRSIGSSRTVTSGTNTKNPFAGSLGIDTSISGVGQTIDVAEEFNKSIIKELIDAIKGRMTEGADFLEDLQKDYQNGLVDFDKILKIDPSKENAVFFIDYFGREVPITSLSSGEKEYLYFYAYLRRIRADKNKIVLIDEPELHLHSSQIRKLCELIAALATKNQIIIATHSGEVLQYFISRANIILLSKGTVSRIQDAEQMRKALEETGLPIDPSVFTAHWICAENDPTVSLHGGGPTTPEVLGWIFGSDLSKRYWSFGSNKATSKIYGEGIASALPAAHQIRVTPLLDGDVLIKSPADYFPDSTPIPRNDLAHFPFWEIENIFLSDVVLNAVIPQDADVAGTDRFWTGVTADQKRLLLCIKKTIAKNSLRKYSLDKYIDNDPQADIDKWKAEIQASTTDLSSVDEKFAEVITSKNWKWLPGKEAIGIAIILEPNFWSKIRDLQQSGQFKTLLNSDVGIKSFIESISALS